MRSRKGNQALNNFEFQGDPLLPQIENHNPCKSKSVWYYTTVVNVHVRTTSDWFLLCSCRAEDTCMPRISMQISDSVVLILIPFIFRDVPRYDRS